MKIMSLRFFSFIAIGLCLSCSESDSKVADRLFNQSKYEEAILAYTKFIDGNPRDIGAIYNRGRAYEETGQIEKAERDFLQITKLDNKNVNAYLSLAKLYYNQEKYTKALIYTESALEVNENSADGYFLNARAQHQLGYTKGAMESYTLAIKINRDYGEAYLYRGALKVHQNLTRSACEDFKKAENLEVPDASSIRKTYCN